MYIYKRKKLIFVMKCRPTRSSYMYVYIKKKVCTVK
jgi:hypothetical protein